MKLFGFEIKRAKPERIPADLSVSSRVWAYSPRLTTGEILANATVASCVGIIADAVAILSCNVYRHTERGRERADGNPLSRLLRKSPDGMMTAFSFKQKIMMHLLVKGNAFIFVERDEAGNPLSLTALPPESVEIKKDEAGNVYYVYTVNGLAYKYTPYYILHIPARLYDSPRGISPLEYASHAARTGLALEEYTSSYFDGGIHSKMLITAPKEAGKLSSADVENLTAQILNAYGGKENANKPFIVSNGFSAQPLNLAGNDDAQLVENRQFSEKEIAKIFRVPLFMLGKDDAKFTNMEQSNTFFLQQTLTPWLVLLQQYFDRLLPENGGYYVEFDTNTLLRADYTARWNNYRENFKTGIFTLNDIMDMENLPRADGEIGDRHYMQLNMTTLDKIAEGEADGKGE